MSEAKISGAVAFQVRRTDGSPHACWESCTPEAYEATVATGRFCGYEKGSTAEARALYLHPQRADLSFDVEAMLAVCVPGGSIVDPQVVADNIRAWVADLKPAELAEPSGNSGELAVAKLVEAASAIERKALPQSRTTSSVFTSDVARLRASLAALAATGKQQVGEVQGDALDALEAAVPHLDAWRFIERGPADITTRLPQTRDELIALAREAIRQLDVIDGHIDAAVEKCKADLDARQDGARPPVGRVFAVDGLVGIEWRNDKHPPAGALIYAAPPAPGINLGQFRPAALAYWSECKGQQMNAVGGPFAQQNAAAEKVKEAERLLALIDQRDAAPGVGS